MLQRIIILVLISFLSLSFGCSGSKKKGDDGVRASNSNGNSGNNANRNRANRPSAVSAKRVFFMNSFSNNRLTSQTYSKQKAENQAARLGGSKNKAALESLLAAQRLAGRGANTAFATAKRIADLEVDRSIKGEISDAVKLDLALAAMGGGKYAMAEHFFYDIIDNSKNGQIKAAAYNAVGVMALRDDRIPEAVAFFRQALKVNSGFKPAKLNLGMLALRGGDFSTAKKNLGNYTNDWMVKASLIPISRLEKNAPQVERMCDQVLKQEPKHKPTMFNCALHELQTKRDFDKARQIVNKMVKTPGGPQSWDESAYALLTKIEFEKARERQAKASRVAQQKQRDREKAKAQAAKKKDAAKQPKAQPARAQGNSK